MPRNIDFRFGTTVCMQSRKMAGYLVLHGHEAVTNLQADPDNLRTFHRPRVGIHNPTGNGYACWMPNKRWG